VCPSDLRQILVEYTKAPQVTRERLYQDAMQQVLSSTTKVMVDDKSGGNLLYLPLDKLMQAAGASPQIAAAAAGTTAASTTAPATKVEEPTTTGNAMDSRSRDAFRSRDREPRP
jgi:membrane protease subunit HflK